MEDLLTRTRKWDFWISGHFSSQWRSEYLINTILEAYDELFKGNILIIGAGVGEEADSIRRRGPSARVELLEIEPAYCLSALMCGHELIDGRPMDLLSEWSVGHEMEFNTIFFLNPDPEIVRENGDHIIEQIDSSLAHKGRFVIHSSGTPIQQNPFLIRFREQKQEYVEKAAKSPHLNRTDPGTAILKKPSQSLSSWIMSLISPHKECDVSY
jgi:hypothetical protein